MKKKIIAAVVAVAVLVLLGVGTVILLRHTGDPSATVDPNAGFAVVDRDSGSVRGVRIELADGTVTRILWNKDESGVETATLAGSAMTVSSSVAAELRRCASYLYANRVVMEHCDNPAEYGLLNPRAVVTVNYADTSTLVFKIGILTPNKAGCYFSVGDGDAVYTMFATTAEVFLRRGDDYRQLPSVGIASETVVALVRQRGAERDSMVLLNTVLGLANWEILEPYRHNLDNDAFSAFLSEVLATAPSKFVAESPADLAPYGFERVNDFVSVIYYSDPENATRTTFTIFFGDTLPDDPSMRYLMFSTSRNVYAVSIDAVSYFDRDLFTVIEKNIVRYNITYLDAITITEPALDRVLHYTIDRTPIVDENGEAVLDDDGKPTYTETFYLDGELKNDEQARALYAAYIKLTADGDIDPAKPVGDVVLDADFTFNVSLTGETGNLTKRVTICQYDNFHYAVLINGKPAFYIEKTKVAKAINDNQLFIDGTLPTLKEQAGYED
ncbi:MAG: DUF4340 domain-containing protein [Eubacteriales bacterium]|nr:DUF4340 domain-containing protein [Eubacteriales bacterium]